MNSLAEQRSETRANEVERSTQQCESYNSFHFNCIAPEGQKKHHTLSMHYMVIRWPLLAVVQGNAETNCCVEDRGGEHHKNNQRLRRRMAAATNIMLLSNTATGLAQTCIASLLEGLHNCTPKQLRERYTQI